MLDVTRPAHEAPPELRAKAADTRTFLDVQWDTFMQADLQYMARALELGQSVRRHTSPNPWVGAVIVRDGQIIGTGATRPPGGLLHAS